MQQLFSELRFCIFRCFPPLEIIFDLFFPHFFSDSFHSFILYSVFFHVIAWTKHNFRFLELIVKEAQRVLKEINFFSLRYAGISHRTNDGMLCGSNRQSKMLSRLQHQQQPTRQQTGFEYDRAVEFLARSSPYCEVVTDRQPVRTTVSHSQLTEIREWAEKRNYKNKFPNRFFLFSFQLENFSNIQKLWFSDFWLWFPISLDIVIVARRMFHSVWSRESKLVKLRSLILRNLSLVELPFVLCLWCWIV